MKPKRIISLLVAVCMVVAMLPVGTATAFAADAVLLKSGDKIKNGNTVYYMEGNYTSAIEISTTDDVTINITGDITGDQSIDYLLRVSANTLTINNQNDYKFEGEGNCKFAILFGKSTVVNGGIYHINGTGHYGAAFLNYDLHPNVSLTLNNVKIFSEGNYVINNRGGLVYINGGYYSSKTSNGYAIINQTVSNGTKVGRMELKNVNIDSNSWALYNEGQMIIDADNDKNSECKGTGGSVYTAAGGTTTIKNGTFSTEGNIYAVGGRGTLNFEGGTVTAPNGSAIAGYDDTAHIKITGGSIENSKRGIRVGGGEVVLKNADFKNNGTDIYLNTDKQITIDDNFKGTLTVDCADMGDNRPITINGDNQKNFKLISTNDEYIVIVHKNDDGTEYQELVKHIGSFVTAKNAVATAEISGEVKTLDDTVQVPEGTAVTVKADKAPEGMVFEKWEVSPAGAITDEAFDLKAETATFKMPACDVTVTAKYAAKEEPVKPEPKPEEPETPVTKLYDLTVKNAEVTIADADGKAVETTKNEDGTLTAKVPEKAAVTVKYTAPTDAIVFDLWSITSDAKLDVNVNENPLTFTMPDKAVTIEAMTRDATIESDGPGILGTAAMIGVGVAGTAVLGYQSYMIGTELYLDYVLPKWAVIPQNRGELALLLWKDAEQPEPTENVLYTDINAEDTDIQKAALWAVENGLMELPDAENNPDHFDPDAPVTRWEVIQTWNQEQEMKKA